MNNYVVVTWFLPVSVCACVSKDLIKGWTDMFLLYSVASHRSKVIVFFDKLKVEKYFGQIVLKLSRY